VAQTRTWWNDARKKHRKKKRAAWERIVRNLVQNLPNDADVTFSVGAVMLKSFTTNPEKAGIPGAWRRVTTQSVAPAWPRSIDS